MSVDDVQPVDIIIALIDSGCTPAEAIDYTMVAQFGYEKNQWARVRDRANSTVAENVKKASAKLNARSAEQV